MKKTVKSILKTIIADTFEYCTADKKFLGLLVVFAIMLSLIIRYCSSINFGNDLSDFNALILLSIMYIENIIVFGYGLQVTEDVINDGKRLPKIMPKKILSFGVKATLILVIFNCLITPTMGACGYLLGIKGDLPLYFLDCLFTDPIYLFETLATYPPLNTIIFFISSLAIGYVLLFFMEISLAMIADTNSFLSSLNIVKIKKAIDGIGWRNYALDYTIIIVALAILFFISNNSEELGMIIGFIIGTIMALLSFIIEFRMIGLTYRNVKANRES